MRFRHAIPEPTVGPILDAIQPRAVTEAVTGYSSLGCYSDSSDRVLNGTMTDLVRNYPQYCCEWCANANTDYTICGVENGYQCFCDSTIREGSSVADSLCNSECGGEGHQSCGASWYMNMYRATTPITTAATFETLTTQGVSDYSYFGCYFDQASRVLRGNVTAPLLNNAAFCCECYICI
ncbi:hypothetical protein G7Z17_g823 [Cylindrodendrum hubeiense]|uniref:WSC domain-containing protein n=1 Tax=Cylindrodendrum hubeiense TaxID=595255 RepID=A0A9P5HG14_9HYPO|nr:hypothetical protein G7Z17_g823 [Cylindrodendrum hubeiense]